MSRHLRNVSLSMFESFLELVHCTQMKGKGGHHKWTRADLNRPIIIQSHIDPVPEFIVRNNLRVLGYSKDDFFDVLESKKQVQREGEIFTLIIVS